MTEPVWIGTPIAEQIHAEQLAAHGGQAGTRDAGMLDSAINRPRQLWTYSDPKPDSYALAASLAFGVSRNHPFLDGNKRTAWVLCRTMLRLAGRDVRVTQAEIVKSVLALAAGEMPEEAFAQWLRDHAEPFEA